MPAIAMCIVKVGYKVYPNNGKSIIFSKNTTRLFHARQLECRNVILVIYELKNQSFFDAGETTTEPIRTTTTTRPEDDEEPEPEPADVPITTTSVTTMTTTNPDSALLFQIIFVRQYFQSNSADFLLLQTESEEELRERLDQFKYTFMPALPVIYTSIPNTLFAYLLSSPDSSCYLEPHFPVPNNSVVFVMMGVLSAVGIIIIVCSTAICIRRKSKHENMSIFLSSKNGILW